MRLLALTFVILAAACGGEDDIPDATPAPDAAPDSALGGACTDTVPAACEESHQSIDDCPSAEEVCAGVCGAAYECCYCGDDGEWAIEFTDCEPCPQDAGP